MIRQPASRNCFVCGRENPLSLRINFYEIEQGQVRAHVKIAELYEGYPGMVHGGVIAAMLDEAAGRSHMQGPNDFMVTVQLNIRYRKPVPSNEDLVLIGIAGQRKGRVAEAKSQVLLEDGTVLAEATGVFVDLPQEKIDEVDPSLLGWQVYPDEVDNDR